LIAPVTLPNALTLILTQWRKDWADQNYLPRIDPLITTLLFAILNIGGLAVAMHLFEDLPLDDLPTLLSSF